MDGERMRLPVPEELKELTVGCSACGQVCPFTLRQYEREDAVIG